MEDPLAIARGLAGAVQQLGCSPCAGVAPEILSTLGSALSDQLEAVTDHWRAAHALAVADGEG